MRAWCADIWKAVRDTSAMMAYGWWFWCGIDMVVAHQGVFVLLAVCSGAYVWCWRRALPEKRAQL